MYAAFEEFTKDWNEDHTKYRIESFNGDIYKINMFFRQYPHLYAKYVDEKRLEEKNRKKMKHLLSGKK